MAIDDNANYTLTGAQVKDLAARIKAGGGGMTVYVDESFASPASITSVFSDSALTTPADPDAMANAISAGGTVGVAYDGSQVQEYIELSSVNSNDRFPEVGKTFTSTISTNAAFSAPTVVTLLYDGGSDSWSVATTAVPTKTSDITNDGSDGTSTYVEADDLATVATSGDYGDLSNTPTIPTVNDATLTIQKNGTTVKTFTANASSNVTANITVPTQFSDLSGTVATAQIANNAVTKAKVDDSGLQTPTVSGANCHYRRSGHFVWVTGAASGFALSANNYKTMFTLPSGYRPPIDIYCPLGLSSATKVGILRIKTSGEVQGWADSNTSYWNFNTTFAIN